MPWMCATAKPSIGGSLVHRCLGRGPGAHSATAASNNAAYAADCCPTANPSCQKPGQAQLRPGPGPGLAPICREAPSARWARGARERVEDELVHGAGVAEAHFALGR